MNSIDEMLQTSISLEEVKTVWYDECVCGWWGICVCDKDNLMDAMDNIPDLA